MVWRQDRIVHIVFNLYQMDRLSVIFALYREDLTQKVKARVNTLVSDLLDRIAPVASEVCCLYSVCCYFDC